MSEPNSETDADAEPTGADAETDRRCHVCDNPVEPTAIPRAKLSHGCANCMPGFVKELAFPDRYDGPAWEDRGLYR